MATGPASGPSVVARTVAIGLALVVGAGTLVVESLHAERATSWFDVSTPAALLGMAAGLSMLAVGAVLVSARHHRPRGWLLLLGGAAWLTPVWAGWETGPGALRTLAEVLAPLVVPILLHRTLLSAPGRAADRRHRFVVRTAYVAFSALAVGRALVREPIRDRDCWVHCGRDAEVFLVWSAPGLGRALGTALLVLTVAAACVALVHGGRGALRGALGASVACAMAALVVEAAYAVMLLASPGERFDGRLGLALFLVGSALLVGLAASEGLAAARDDTARRGMARLALELGESPAPGELEANLARTLRDDSLAVRYWLAGERRYVDASGRPVEGDDADPRMRALVVRGREPVAMVLHSGAVAGGAVEEALGPAARVVIDSERLRAERLAQLLALRESRARLVAATDGHRASLERDLHDGAQQRLVTATYELRLARADAAAAGDDARAAALEEAVEESVQLLDQLREFAHGVFPAILDESGLAEAVWSLTDTAVVPVAVHVEIDRDVPREVARTAYLLVKAAVDAPGADALRLRLTEGEGALMVDIDGVGPVDESYLADRVGAVGGVLRLGEGRLTAVIACAS
jgi:signal transduction histidine kinase